MNCEHKTQYKAAELFTQQSFPEHKSVKGEILPLEIISKPVGLACKDSILFVNNTAVEHMIYCYNLNTYQKVGEFIPFGTGPNEMLSIKNISIDKDSVWISTFQPSKLYQFDIKQFYRQQEVIPCRETELRDGTLNSIIPMNENEIVTTSYRADNNRLSFYDYNGKHIRDIGTYPDFGKELTISEQHEAFLCTLIKLPGQRILLAYMNTDLLEIYDTKGNLIKRMHGPDHFFPSAKETKMMGGTMVISDKDAKGAYFNPLLIGDEIWIIYSGNSFTPKGPDSYDHLFQNKIYIFDQELNPLRTLSLDIPIATLAVNPADKSFYGISMQPEVVIVKYQY